MVQAIREGSYWVPLIGAVILVTMTGHAPVSVLLVALGMIDARASAVVYVWDPETLRFTFADPEAEQQSGYTPDELYDMTVPDLTGKPVEHYKAIADILARSYAASVKTIGLFCHKDDGMYHPHLGRHSLMVVPGRKPQILVQARAMMPDELTAPACVLSVS